MNTFWWPRKFYVCISNRFIKYSCIMCTTFPPSPNKCKLHVKTTCCHYILHRYTFSTNKWDLIFLWYTCTYMYSINRSNAILEKQKICCRINLILLKYLIVTFWNIITTCKKYVFYLEMGHVSRIHCNFQWCCCEFWIYWSD